MTRQPAAALLRATAFAHLSAQFPTASRKHRRAAARLAARGLGADARREWAAAGGADEAGYARPGDAPGGDGPR